MSQEQSDRIEASKVRAVYSNYVVDQELVLLKKQLTAKIVNGSGATLEGSSHLDIKTGQLVLTPEQVSTLKSSVIPILQAPTNITLIPGNEEITVTFTGPVSVDFPVTNYEYSIDGGVTFVLCNPPKTASPIVVPGLTNGTSYLIVLKAINQFGPGLPSSPVSGSPQPLAPTAPTNVRATPGFEQITLLWSPPLSNGGSEISKYLITYNGITRDVGTATTSTITGLLNGTLYTFQITATNTSSITGPAATISATPYDHPVEISPAPVPTNSLDSSTVLANQINLTWTAPLDQGSVITKYTLQWTPADATGTKIITGSPPATNTLITGLTNGTYYTFTAYATNAGGDGPLSQASGEYKPVGPPTPPTNLSGTVGSTGRVDLFWSPPNSDQGSNLTGYTITGYDISGSAFVSSQYLPTTITDLTLTNYTYAVLGLTNGKPYRFTITAKNAYFALHTIGDPGILTLIPGTRPNIPIPVSVTVANESCTVTWSAPNNNGYDIQYYTVTCRDNSGVLIQTVSPIYSTFTTITGLTNGSPYTFTVSATNTIGTSDIYTYSPATPAKGPDAPTISGVPLNSSIRVTITPPTDTGGNPIAGYRYQVNALAYQDTLGSNPFTIPGLTNGTAYSVNVQAYTIINSQNVYSLASAPITVTPSTVPSAPRNASATIDDRQTSVSWLAPLSTGGASISGYIFRYNDASGNLQQSNESSTSKLITGLKNGFQYTFSIVATNFQGSSPAATVVVTPCTTPSAFTGVSKLDGNTFGYIYFDPVDNGGSPILAYEYYYLLSGVRTPSSGVQSTNLTYADNSLTISGLTNGLIYEFYIQARNARGAGPTYGPVSVSPKTPTPPFAPINPIGTAFSTYVTIAFRPGDNGNRIITDYKYSLAVNGFYVDVYGTPILDTNGNPIPAAGAITTPIVYLSTNITYSPDPVLVDEIPQPTTATITGLTNGTQYTIRLIAVNNQGDGVPSPPVVLTPATTPSAPSIVSATAGVRTASISLTCVNGGQPILNYLYSTNGGTTFTELSPAQPNSPITISGLTNGFQYTFYIKARNIVGTGAASSGVSVTLPDVPATGVAPTVQRDVSGSIQVTWTAPFDGGLSITGYSVYAYNSSNISQGTTLDSSGIRMTPFDFNITTGVIGGLINGAPYTFKFTATNAAGTSGLSPASSSIQPGSQPLAPQILAYTVAYDTITVTSYSAPSDIGGFPIQRYEYSMDSTNWYLASGSPTRNPFTTYTLTNGQVYTIYLRAVNEIAPGVPTSQSGILVASVPFQMSKPTVTLGISQQIIVTWSPPTDNGGSAVTGYIVNAYDASNNLFTTRTFSNTATSGGVGGLTNAASYTFKVAATNVKGTGDLSPASDSISPATVPAQMAAPGLTRGGSGEINLTWIAPSNGGATISGYTVTAYNGSTNNVFSSTQFSGTANSGTVGGLTNGNTYTFKISATNVQGPGTDSPRSASLVAATVPDQMAAPTVVRGITQQLIVSWTAPSSTGGFDITGYILSLYSSSEIFIAQYPFNSTIFSASISSLTNGTYYKFKVAAKNIIGTSDLSPFSIAEKPATVPSVPAAPSVSRGGSGEVALTWAAPSSNGGADVSGYTITTCDISGNPVTLSDVNGNPIGPFVYSGSTLSATVQFLVNGTTYRFTVAATNSQGSSTSVSSLPIVPATVPDAPQTITATVYSQYITIQITAGSSQGSLITGYQYSINGGASWINTSDSIGSPFTITGLTNGTTVTVYVRAVNGIGPGTSASTSVVMFYPAAPTGISGTIPNVSGSVSLRWTPPTPTSGYPFTGYTITSVPTSPPYTITDGAARSYTVSGLTNGTAYVFSIAATIAQGSGTPGSSAPLTPIGYPTAPTGVSGISLDSSVQVSWTPGTSFAGYSVLGYYVYTYNESAVLVKTSPRQASSPYTVPSLTPLSSYTFTVAANISQGNGPESTSSAPVTVLTLPGAPQGLIATYNAAVGQVTDSITVTWNTGSTGGTPLTGYTLTYLDPSGNLQTPSYTYTANYATGTSTIISPPFGFSYIFNVTASNSIGTSPQASYQYFTSPSAPLNVSATVGNGQTTVSWVKPLYTGDSSGVVNYSVMYTIYPSSTIYYVTLTNGSTYSYTIQGLINGIQYIFSVAAINTENVTGPAGYTGIVILLGPPTVPQNVVAIAGNTSFTIKWSAPASNGGLAILNYQISSGGVYSYVNASTFNYTVQGLTNGTWYSYAVQAVNSFGPGASASITSMPTSVGFTILAGGGAGGTQAGFGTGQGTNALFNYPQGLAIDSSGVVYVADTSNNVIQKITSGLVTSFVGGGSGTQSGFAGTNAQTGTNALMNLPYGLTVDSTGILYVTDSINNIIRKITTAGVVTIFAGGLGMNTSSNNNAKGTSAGFFRPWYITLDSNKNLYVGANYATIRKIGTDSTVTTFAGGGTGGVAIGYGTGQGTNALFNQPKGLAIDSSGTLYVADYINCAIRKVGTDGTVTNYAGLGFFPGITGTGVVQGTNAAFRRPEGIAIDSNRNLYVIDNLNSKIRKIDPSGNVSTLAGGGTSGNAAGIGTGNPLGLTAQFNSPRNIAIDSNGNIYVADTGNNTIKVSYAVNVAPPGVPTAPTNLVGLPASNAAVISFTASSANGGDAIATYQYSVGTNFFTTGFTGTASPLTITNITDGGAQLQNKVTYTIAIAAVNTSGIIGLPSAPVTVTPLSVPPAPTNISATAGPYSILVGWTIPTPYPDYPISGFGIVCYDSGNNIISTTTLRTPLSTSGTVSGLTTPGSYTVKVYATTDFSGVGYPGTYSVASSPVTPLTAPSLPQNVSATVGDRNSLITWTTPASNGGSAILSYTITWSGGSATVNTATRNYVAEGLTNGTLYTFNVTATNSVGTGLPGSASITPVKSNQNPYVSILAGGGATGNASGVGTAGQGTNALFNNPYGIAVDSNGTVYVADYNNNTIKTIGTTGIVTSCGYCISCCGRGSKFCRHCIRGRKNAA